MARAHKMVKSCIPKLSEETIEKLALNFQRDREDLFDRLELMKATDPYAYIRLQELAFMVGDKSVSERVFYAGGLLYLALDEQITVDNYCRNECKRLPQLDYRTLDEFDRICVEDSKDYCERFKKIWEENQSISLIAEKVRSAFEDEEGLIIATAAMVTFYMTLEHQLQRDRLEEIGLL